MDRVCFASDQEDSIVAASSKHIEVPRLPASDLGKASSNGARDNSTGHGAKFVVPEGWKLCIHPQGMIYFYNSALRIVVDEDVRDAAIYRSTMQKFEDLVSLGAVMEEDELELCLQPDTPDETAGQFDMFVNHVDCIASYNIQDVRPGTAAQLDPRTLNRRRSMYWNHIRVHPSHVPLAGRALPDAADALAWFYTDNLISGNSSFVPFSRDECDNISKTIHTMSQPCYEASPAKSVFLAWLLSEVCRFRHSEHYGQHTVNQSKIFRARNRGPQPPPQLDKRFQPAVDLLIRLLFFGIPHTYLAHIKNSGDYRGRLSSIHANWVAYIDRLVREYSHFLLIGTVLLSATVGLLAVPGISNAVLVTALVSAFASLGSIILSVVSIWRHQINTQPRNSFMYMHNINQGPLGLHGHAMFLSLPPVLLIWGIVAFTTSLIVYTLQGLIGPLREEMNDGNGATQITSISGWIVLAILVVILVTVLGGLYTFSVIWKFRSPKSRLRALRATLFPKSRTSITITPADSTPV
ncbi:hypothetical protein PTI98_004632 [Pleurotus ostreatus]|nr:hypothetical protein PTI98_004632 [Pleurotus ostreatus]